MIAKLLAQNTLFIVALGAVLFASAGSLHWPAAWVFLAVSAVIGTVCGLWLAKTDPGLLAERMRPTFQAGQPAADKKFMLVFVIAALIWLIAIGLDWRRHASNVPLAMQALGLAMYLTSTALIMWVFRENSFAAPVVRVQAERAHHLVSTGPYAFVRHPMPGLPSFRNGAPPHLRRAIAHRRIRKSSDVQIARGIRCLHRPGNDLRQFAAKQYSNPSPPVLLRSACEQPPSGPREGCEEFHDFDASSSRSPMRSECPTTAEPCVLLVQFLQVRSSPPANAVPSGCDPVSTSWRFGVSPRPLMTSPFSDNVVCLVRLLPAL